MVYDRKVAEEIVGLGNVCMDFAQVLRKPRHADGRQENDAEHSFMLGVIAMAVGARFLPQLDLGLVSQYALVHDLIELRIGDTHSYNLGESEAQSKEAAEAQALPPLLEELAAWPHLQRLVVCYQRQNDYESRFVRVVDKIMPSITNILDMGRVLQQEHGVRRREELARAVESTTERMIGYIGDQSEALAIRTAVTDYMLESLFDENGEMRQKLTEAP